MSKNITSLDQCYDAKKAVSLLEVINSNAPSLLQTQKNNLEREDFGESCFYDAGITPIQQEVNEVTIMLNNIRKDIITDIKSLKKKAWNGRLQDLNSYKTYCERQLKIVTDRKNQLQASLSAYLEQATEKVVQGEMSSIPGEIARTEEEINKLNATLRIVILQIEEARRAANAIN